MMKKIIDIRIFLYAFFQIIYLRFKMFVSGKRISEEDKVFWDRIIYNPRAFFLSYWSNHFELNSLSEYPEISGKVLDFGCGSGHLDVLLAKNGYDIYGIDLSIIGIKLANKLSKITKTNNVLFDLCDITKSVPKQKFDSCRSTQVFEHIKDPSDIFLNMKKRIKPKGKILISVPLGYAYDDKGHVNHFMNGNDLKMYLKEHINISRVDVDKKNKTIRALCYFN